MRFLAAIEEAPEIARILRHAGAGEPSPPLRVPPDEEDRREHNPIPLSYSSAWDIRLDTCHRARIPACLRGYWSLKTAAECASLHLTCDFSRNRREQDGQ